MAARNQRAGMHHVTVVPENIDPDHERERCACCGRLMPDHDHEQGY